MADAIILTQFRRFLLLLAASMCLGTIAELWLTNHMENPIQFVPFVGCSLGFLAVGWVLLRPQRRAILALRGVMLLVALAGAFGTFEHLEHNLDFAREIKAEQAAAAPLWSALTGANPPLAPGLLAVTALVAVAATYRHPEI